MGHWQIDCRFLQNLYSTVVSWNALWHRYYSCWEDQLLGKASFWSGCAGPLLQLEAPAVLRLPLWPLGCLGIFLAVNVLQCRMFSCTLSFLCHGILKWQIFFFCFLIRNRETVCFCMSHRPGLKMGHLKKTTLDCFASCRRLVQDHLCSRLFSEWDKSSVSFMRDSLIYFLKWWVGWYLLEIYSLPPRNSKISP